MRWPWVSMRVVEELERQLERERARYDRLLDRLLAIRVSNTVINEVPTDKAVRADDPMDKVIDELKNAHKSGWRRNYQSYVAAERARGIDDQTIADKLRHWYDIDPLAAQPDDDDTIAIQ